MQGYRERSALSEQIETNNNTIRNLTREYRKIEPDCREGVRAQLEREEMWGVAVAMPYFLW